MSQELIFEPRLQSAKSLAWWLYVMHGASFVFSLGAFSWVPLIINFIKRDDSAGTFVYSHHSWQIRSFFWYLFWMVLGGILFFTLIGPWIIWSGAWIWKAYRLLKGFIYLNDNRPMPV